MYREDKGKELGLAESMELLTGQVGTLLRVRKQGILGNTVTHSRTQCVLCQVFSSFLDHCKYWTSDLNSGTQENITCICEGLGVAHSVHELGAVYYGAFCIVGFYWGASFHSKW